MSLKLKRRRASPYWYVRGTIRGKPVNASTGTVDKTIAEAYRAKRETELHEESIFGARAVVSFRHAALSYLEHDARTPRTVALVQRLVDFFPLKRLSYITQSTADDAVEHIVGKDASPATKIRAVYTPLTAILNHAAKRDWCAPPKFDRPKVPRSATRWLAPAEAVALRDAAAPHLRALLTFLVCTGARLAEALELQWATVDLAGARAVFLDTKNSRDRPASLPPGAIEALANLPGRDGHVFRRDDGLPYADRKRLEGGQIKTAWATACRRTGIEDATPHDLRHTWATYFYGLTRDPMLLRDEGGWCSIAMVEKYAHLMPSVLLPDIAKIWGATHPRIGRLPMQNPRTKRVRPA